MCMVYNRVNCSPVEMRNVSEASENNIVAYGDESVLLAVDPPLYLLGASIFKGDQRSVVEALERIKPKGAAK